MERVNIAEARERLEELIDRAAAGETIVIAREDGPDAQLTAADRASQAMQAPRFDPEAVRRRLARLPMDPRTQEEIDAALRSLDRY